MSDTATTSPLRYRGSSNKYVDIAIRGTDEAMGLNVEYAAHPNGIGCFIVRFVVHGEGVSPAGYKHLTYRETAKFATMPTGTDIPAMFKGVRLNKLAIPVFKPAVFPHEVAGHADALGIWPLVTEWIAEQVTTEGFVLTVDLQAEIKAMVTFKVPETTGKVESVIDFPNLADTAHQKAAAKLAKKPVDDDDDEDADLDEDEDDDKDWLQ